MSSEHFSEAPLPASRKSCCPLCGAAICQGATKRCWMCGKDFALITDAEIRAARIREQSAHIEAARGGQDHAAFVVFGILAILVSAGLMVEAPGILVVLLVLAVPALIRTAVQSAGQDERSASTSALARFFSSLGLLVIVGLASFAAFFATCFAVCLGGLALNDLNRNNSQEWIFTASIGAGIVPGLFVAGLLFKHFWSRKGSS
jgi:hypothetical protein